MVIASLLISNAYLLGSFSSAVIVCWLMGLPDPRTQGSKNPGATNVLRHGGKKAAIITLCLDILKGVVAVLIAKLVTTSTMILAGVVFAVFLGHLYPIFFKFRGGKGVATAFGALTMLVWPVGLFALAMWLLTAFLFRYSSLAALSAAVSAPIAMYWFSGESNYVMMTCLLSVLMMWRHRSNMLNLIKGEEDKIGVG
jgi:glycerol-3-phosphate acyltransferase PlsY